MPEIQIEKERKFYIEAKIYTHSGATTVKHECENIKNRKYNKNLGKKLKWILSRVVTVRRAPGDVTIQNILNSKKAKSTTRRNDGRTVSRNHDGTEELWVKLIVTTVSRLFFFIPLRLSLSPMPQHVNSLEAAHGVWCVAVCGLTQWCMGVGCTLLLLLRKKS